MSSAPAPTTIHYSVTVPAYNAERTLPACLESLSKQTLSKEDYEIIVVDDGSSDGTSRVAKQFDIRYLYQPNQGPAAARNHGAEVAAGQIILFTDADCVPAANWLEQMTAPFADEHVVAVKGAYATRQTEFMARFAQMEFEDRYDLLQKNHVIDMIDTYSAAFRKNIFLGIGSFDRNFPTANNEDTELSYRLAAAGHRMIFNRHAVVLHEHPDSLRKYLQIKFWRAYWRMIVYRRFPQKAFKDSYTPATLKLQTMLMAFSMILLMPTLLWPATFWLIIIMWGGILASTVPFSLKALKKNRAIGLMAPGVLFLRSAVFAAGSMMGIVRSFFFPGFEQAGKEVNSRHP